MRPALIGPLPPELGGLTPGGVATHQAALAAGLAEQVPISLLASNTRLRSPRGWRRCQPAAFTLYRQYLPDRWAAWLSPLYLRRVGPARLVRYAARLARLPAFGSRRETLAHLLWYRRFLHAARPDLIHVQHPLERLTYLRLLATLDRECLAPRSAGAAEGRLPLNASVRRSSASPSETPFAARAHQMPLVVTAHSFFGEHADAVIFSLMAPNLRAADRVIAVSPHIADQAVQLGAEPSRVRVIRSGVDTARFQPRDRLAARQQLNVDPSTPLVLFVGNLEPRKQVHLLLQALASVRQAVPTAQLAIVGTGHSAGADDQTSHLQQLSRDLALAAAVRFVGHVSADDLLAWYAAADTFALPSSSEAQGIVALEAMACGLPVVASAVGGLLGTIQDGQSGWLVPAGDTAALAARLTDVLLDAELRQRIGAAARARVLREFTWPRAVAATLAVYHELLDGACPA